MTAVKEIERPKQDARGRPFTFAVDERARLAELIRQYGIRGAQRVAGVPISIETLIKIGREFNIKLPKGRRRSDARIGRKRSAITIRSRRMSKIADFFR